MAPGVLAGVLCALLCACSSASGSDGSTDRVHGNPFVPTAAPVPFSGDVLRVLFECPSRPNYVSANSRVYRCAPAADALAVLRRYAPTVYAGASSQALDPLTDAAEGVDDVFEDAVRRVQRIVHAPGNVTPADLSALNDLLARDESVAPRLFALGAHFFTSEAGRALAAQDADDGRGADEDGEPIAEDMYASLLGTADDYLAVDGASIRAAVYPPVHLPVHPSFHPSKHSQTLKRHPQSSAQTAVSRVFTSDKSHMPPRYRVASVPRDVRHSALAPFYAVKVVACADRATEEAVRREVRWLHVARAVPNVARYVASFWDATARRMYVVTQWVGGTFGMSLDELARLLFRAESTPAHVERLCSVVAHDVLSALARMHALQPGESSDADGATALVHADVKPGNIFVRPSVAARLRASSIGCDSDDNIDSKGAIIGPKGASIDSKGAMVDPKGSTIDSKGSTIDSKGFTIDSKGSTVDVKGSTIDPKGSTVDAKGSTVDVKGSTVDVMGKAKGVYGMAQLSLAQRPAEGADASTFVLGDFGNCVAVRPGGPLPRAAVCTLPFRSPEMARGDPYGPAHDVWSLGVVLYALVAGDVPYAFCARTGWPLGESALAALRSEHALNARIAAVRTPPVLPPDVPATDAVRDLVARCLEPDAAKRWSARRLLDEHALFAPFRTRRLERDGPCDDDVRHDVRHDVRRHDDPRDHDSQDRKRLRRHGLDAVNDTFDAKDDPKDDGALAAVAAAAPPAVRALLVRLFAPGRGGVAERRASPADAPRGGHMDLDTGSFGDTRPPKERLGGTESDKLGNPKTEERGMGGSVAIDIDALVVHTPTPEGMLAEHGLGTHDAPWRALALPPCIEAAYILDPVVGGEMVAQTPSGFLDAVVLALDGRPALEALGRSSERIALLESAAARVAEFVARHWLPARLGIVARPGEGDRGACALFCYAAFTLHARLAGRTRPPPVTALELAAAVVRAANAVVLGDELPAPATVRVAGAAPGGVVAASQCIVALFGGADALAARLAAKVGERRSLKRSSRDTFAPTHSAGLDALGGVRIDRRPEALAHAPGGVFRAIEKVAARAASTSAVLSSSDDNSSTD